MAEVVAVAFDSNTVGTGVLAGALVTAIGYMLWDRRDTDKRVDTATQALIDAIRDQRDEALRERDRARTEVADVLRDLRVERGRRAELRHELDMLRERLRIIERGDE